VIKEVGVGTFGRVLECFDLDDDGRRKVAIKVVRNIKRYTESASIEAQILKDVGEKSVAASVDVCVKLYAEFEFEGMKHICLCFVILISNFFASVCMCVFSNTSIFG
jgi:serine/threonine protein kinase